MKKALGLVLSVEMRAEGDLQGDASGLLELRMGDFGARGKGIIAAILHTDMVKHNEMIKELASS